MTQSVTARSGASSSRSAVCGGELLLGGRQAVELDDDDTFAHGALVVRLGHQQRCR